MEKLRVRNLTRIYGEGVNRIVALDNVSFSINKGEFVSIVGPSGSGKSTLLNLIGGVDKASSGEIYIDGINICNLDNDSMAMFRRRNVGIIYQVYNLLPILSVEENIILPLTLDNQNVDVEVLDGILEILHMSDKRDYLPSQLSGGQQQKTAIGRAIITNPAIILADEPTRNLDSKSSYTIVNLLKKLARDRNQTIIMITHDRKIANTADRTFFMEYGKILEQV